MKTQSDQPEFAAALVARDIDAWGVFVRKHTPALLRYVRHLGRSWMTELLVDADDLVQLTFVRAYRSIDRLDKSRAVEPWLFTIARNTTFKAKREAQKRRDAERASELLCLPTHHVETPIDELLFTTAVSKLQTALADLSPRTREVLLARCMEDQSYETIAERFGFNTVEACRTCVSRAISRVKRALGIHRTRQSQGVKRDVVSSEKEVQA